jgi:thymidylate kinase
MAVAIPERTGARVMTAKRGRLIALDGSAVGLTAAAKDVARALAAADVPRGVSPWDASGIFTELFAGGPAVRVPSARTLTLLYAADLAFRLRWQIVPALAEGRCVIAAPYVETAKAVALAAGLPRKWLVELFRFAPRPDGAYHVTQRSHPAAAARSYFECFSTTLERSDVQFDDIRTRAREYLASLERGRRFRRLTAAALTTVARQRG